MPGEETNTQPERRLFCMKEQEILLQLTNILTLNHLLTPDEKYHLVEKIRSEVE